MFNRRIYLDYASLTPIDRRVQKEIRKYSSIKYANPSSLYKEGVVAKKAMNLGRARVAGFIQAQPNSITFTSGGTESNNLALIGSIEFLREKGVDYDKMHVIISVIEHSSIRETANYLSGKGVAVDILSVDSNGLISLEDLKNKLRPNTVIVSIMTVNNEIGTIQPIREIVKVIRTFRKNNPKSTFDFQDFKYPIFHIDAAQATLYEELNVEKMGVGLLTLDGAKVYGPRGIGVLFIRRDTPVVPIIQGGGQEAGMRSGTENIGAIMGFAKALELAAAERFEERVRIGELRNFFIKELEAIKPDITVNGEDSSLKRDIKEIRSPHILNISIPGIDNEFFVLQLDAKGIACSTKSSCLGDEEESYVLKAIGADSKTSIRFSFGRWTTKREIKRLVKVISNILGVFS
ncbi:MAG: cysteine desulfurase family protein [Candidatus Taylorbacteria bacterium]|nr:cysteine desulfurase family protein [Candidatus Taylorbacteria bacterium]